MTATPRSRAEKRLTQAADAFKASKEQHETDRGALAKAIADAFRAGLRPSEIERLVPYDRQHIARIRDAAGIPASRPATVVSKSKVVDPEPEH